ncbi:MAG: hypothetical protein E5W55_32300, partial [Mesorhizobium sp.]
RKPARQPISPLAGEMPGRAEGGVTERNLCKGIRSPSCSTSSKPRSQTCAARWRTAPSPASSWSALT